MKRQLISLIAVPIGIAFGGHSLSHAAIPSITTQPTDQTVNAPAPAQFSVTATGTPAPQYQWQVSTNQGTTWSNVQTGTGGLKSTYTTIATALTFHGRQYRVIVHNADGRVISDAATLTVKTWPSITIQPQNKTVLVPAKASFAVQAVGNPLPAYQWQVSVNQGKEWNDLAGETNPTYVLDPTHLEDQGKQFRVAVTNERGSVFSRAAVLTIKAAPVITLQPADADVHAPAKAQFKAAATGAPAPTCQWQASADGGKTWNNVASGTGGTTPTYTTSATALAMQGRNYRMVASNAVGRAISQSATLTVQSPPIIIKQPVGKTVLAPAKAVFSVSVAGYPVPACQWQTSSDGSSWDDVTSGTGGNTTTYTIDTTSLTDNGRKFRAVLTNVNGTLISTSVSLIVHAAPQITVQPVGCSVLAGQHASFSVTATGTAPLSYQWRKNGVGISGAISNHYQTPATTLADQGANYSVVVSNAYGMAISSPATLNVQAPPSISVFKATPASITAGQSTQLSWTVARATLLSIEPGLGDVTGQTTLTIFPSVNTTYVLTATNALGHVTAQAMVVVHPVVAPAITTQPQNKLITTGQTATFTVVASGTSPLHYQWQKNGADIINAQEASYTTPVASLGDNGATYRVVVDNTAGQVQSAPATLQVMAKVGTWVTDLPPLVPNPIPLADVSAPTTIIDTQSGGSDKTDAQLANALQAALNKGGVIIFDAHGVPRTIRLTKQLYIPVQGTESNGWNNSAPVVLDGGDLITLDGGSDTSGNGGSRILEKAWLVDFTVQRMDFANANASHVTSGRTDDDKSGGAINVENWDGALTVIDCRFTNCRAVASGPDVGGGAVHCPGQKWARFDQCTFEDCSGSNGGAIDSLGSELWLLDCVFSGCKATGTGGGADAGPNGKGGIGGAVYIDGISNNSAHAILRVENSRFLDNGANDHGGAIFLYTYENSGSRSLINACTFHHNRILSASPKVGFSGAIYSQNSELTVVSSTFDANTSVSMGGAIWHSSTTTSRIADCTFSANVSGNFGSALQLNGPMYVSNTTLTDNVCSGTWGGAVRSGTPANTWLKNCILANNLCATPEIGNVSDTYQEGGGNYQWPSGTGQKKATSSVTFADTLLGPLADNGGPTFTRLPAPGSPAVNGGTNTLCPPLDQRGLPRVGNCDAGSAELQ